MVLWCRGITGWYRAVAWCRINPMSTRSTHYIFFKFLYFCQLQEVINRPSNTIENDSKQQYNSAIIYYHNSVAIVNDSSVIWVWFDNHRYVNYPCKKVEKLLFFSKISTIIYYWNTVVCYCIPTIVFTIAIVLQY